jgi:hypothetical protein
MEAQWHSIEEYYNRKVKTRVDPRIKRYQNPGTANRRHHQTPESVQKRRIPKVFGAIKTARNLP